MVAGMRIEGLTALVTGGASGLGRATAEALLDGGGNVVLCDLERSNGEAVAKEMGERALFVPADVTSEEQMQAAVAATVERFGAIHIGVSCAGIGPPQRTITRNGPHDLGLFELVIRVNLIGTFNTIRLVADQMAKQEPIGEERGVIVNTASVAAFDGQIGQAGYSASKGGIVAMTLPIARDLATMQIRVCTIAPGTFDTPLLAMLPEPQREALGAQIPHPKRLGKPEEFAALARHIVENPMLNGETIRLDGAIRMAPK
jgi:NAD(P)-dependent dehydrogenase (short-subunit alcohol dehydrogenase family)